MYVKDQKHEEPNTYFPRMQTRKRFDANMICKYIRNDHRVTGRLVIIFESLFTCSALT